MAELHRADVDLDGLFQVLGQNLYSTPEVAIRELVQNAHDSCLRREIEEGPFPAAISVVGDRATHTVTLTDNGAGLTDDEIRRYLATLGAGYTRLLRASSSDDRLIGAFGLGFLSAYVVSDRVEVVTTSWQTPDRTWRFASRNGQQYSITPEATAPVGTRVILHLRADHYGLADPNRLGRVLERYCCLLPIPVSAPEVVNAEPPPWRSGEDGWRLKKRRTAFARRFEPVFEPLCTIPLAPVPGVEAHGLLWVQDGGTYGTSDHRHVSLFVRGMAITDDARKLVPDWAGFVGAVIQCDALVPTASREDVQRDDVFLALARHVAESLVDGLSRIAEDEPEAWRRVTMRHNEALLGAALCEPRLFDLLGDTLTVPTTEGDLPMTEILDRSPGPVVVSTGEESGAEEVLFRALSRPVVHGIRYGALAFARRVAEAHGRSVVVLGTGTDTTLFPTVPVPPATRDRLQTLLGAPDTAVVPTRFVPRSLPVLLVPDREVLLKRRLEQDEVDGRIAGGLLTLARGFTAGIDGSTAARLYVNLDCPLIVRMMALTGERQEQAATLVRGLAELAGRTGSDGDLGKTLDQLCGALTALLT